MLVAVFLACSSPAPTPAPAPAADPQAHEGHEAMEKEEAGEKDEGVRPAMNLGKEPDVTAAVSIDEVLAKSADYEGKAVVVKGPVTAVCQEKGCWHRLGTADPNVTVLVKDKEYEVFLPMDSAGKTAVVSGIFHHEELSLEHARHLAMDAGKDPNTITAPVKEYTIDVDGVKFI